MGHALTKKSDHAFFFAVRGLVSDAPQSKKILSCLLRIVRAEESAAAHPCTRSMIGACWSISKLLLHDKHLGPCIGRNDCGHRPSAAVSNNDHLCFFRPIDMVSHHCTSSFSS